MRARGASGFALVAVLWILVMLGTLGIAFQAAARAERRAVANARAASRAHWAARAGLARVVNSIDRALSGGPGLSAKPASEEAVLPPLEYRSGAVTVRVSTLDARARVQINQADDRQLRRLFSAMGLGRRGARALAEAVLDWRDPDSFRRSGGVESDSYVGLGPPSRPKNAPFERVEELTRVPGMTPEVYERVAPYLTVSGDGRINLNAAALPVLVTLPGVDANVAAAIVARRRSRRFQNPFEVAAALPEEAREWIEADMEGFMERVAFGPREVDVVAVAAVDGSPVSAEIRAVVLLAGGTSWQVTRYVER